MFIIYNKGIIGSDKTFWQLLVPNSFQGAARDNSSTRKDEPAPDCNIGLHGSSVLTSEEAEQPFQVGRDSNRETTLGQIQCSDHPASLQESGLRPSQKAKRMDLGQTCGGGRLGTDIAATQSQCGTVSGSAKVWAKSSSQGKAEAGLCFCSQQLLSAKELILDSASWIPYLCQLNS